MTFRSRLIIAVVGTSLFVLALSFVVLYAVVHAAEVRQLDAAILAEAREEAAEIAAAGRRRLVIEPRPGPIADDTGPLTRYAAIYDESGRVVDRTSTLKGDTPSWAKLDTSGVPFDLQVGQEPMRAVVLPIPDSEAHLLLAAPRAFLDADATFLLRSMALMLIAAIVCALLLSSWVMSRLTRDHASIAKAVHAVADGDLQARVPVPPGKGETAQLVRDINHMIGRVAHVVDAQRRFIAHASHELRSPITLLRGELELALRRPRDVEGYRHAIREALDATHEVARLSDDLLALARLEARSPLDSVDLDLADLVRRVVGRVERDMDASQVRADLQLEPVVLRGHLTDMERCVYNLVHNAFRFSPAGGEVRIRLGAREGRARLEVEDDGPGVPEEVRAHIFDPFYRSSQSGAWHQAGTGLGLTFVREAAAVHGGEVHVADPQGGRGARFVIDIPLAGEARASPMPGGTTA